MRSTHSIQVSPACSISAAYEQFIPVELIDLARHARRLHLFAHDHPAASAVADEIDVAISLVESQFGRFSLKEFMVGDLDASLVIDSSGFVSPDAQGHGAVGADTAPGIADVV
jgi:hypothetical protein